MASTVQPHLYASGICICGRVLFTPEPMSQLVVPAVMPYLPNSHGEKVPEDARIESFGDGKGGITTESEAMYRLATPPIPPWQGPRLPRRLTVSTRVRQDGIARRDGIASCSICVGCQCGNRVLYCLLRV